MGRKTSRARQQHLFGPEEAAKPIRDWRAVPLDPLPEDESGLRALEERLLALSRRSRSFLKALSIAGTSPGDEDVEVFARAEFLFIGNLSLLLRNKMQPLEVHDVLECARNLDQELADRRRRMLGALAPETCRRVLAAEPRVRIQDFEIRWDALNLDFSWAEEQGETVEIAPDDGE